MSRQPLAAFVGLALIFGGCVDPENDPTTSPAAVEAGGVTPEGDLVVDRLRDGDTAAYTSSYTVTQMGQTTKSSGTVTLQTSTEEFTDGFGTPRTGLRLDALATMTIEGEDHNMAEAMILDPETQMQLRHDFPVMGRDINAFPMEPLSTLPVSRQTAVDQEGIVQDFAPNPLGRGAVVYGLFVANHTLVPGASFEFWGVLFTFAPYNATIKGSTDKDGSPVRTVTVDALNEQPNSKGRVQWIAEFRPDCPLPAVIKQTRAYEFPGLVFSDTTELTRTACEHSTETTELPPSVPWAGKRSGERLDWDQLPPDGSGPQLRFRLSEMYTALAQHPVASQYFSTHPDAYLQFAFLEEVNTCPVYQGVSPPGCHWDTWRGFFQDADKTLLLFTVERASNADGSGVAYVPLVEREYPFNAVFSMIPPGGPPPPPPGQPQVVTVGADIPARDILAPDTFPVSAAIDVWKETASPAHAESSPNVAVVSLGPDGYDYFLSRVEWVYPEPAQLFPLYGNTVQSYDVHLASIFGDGYLAFQLNLELHVTHS